MKPWIDGQDIDREYAEKALCMQCGSPMEYDPRYDEDDVGEKTYRAFAVCMNPECDNEFEF